MNSDTINNMVWLMFILILDGWKNLNFLNIETYSIYFERSKSEQYRVIFISFMSAEANYVQNQF
jgi:hypothetical protein